MSTVVATNINTDALVGNTSANAITVRGEGSATTSLQQGLAKAWLSFNQNTSDDSFNMSSVTDSSTGNFITVLSNNMSNVNYSEAGICRTYHINSSSDDNKTTTGDKHQTFYVSNTNGARTSHDVSRSHVSYFGDLA